MIEFSPPIIPYEKSVTVVDWREITPKNSSFIEGDFDFPYYLDPFMLIEKQHS